VSNRVELGDTDAVRDSKNPAGPTLAADVTALVHWVANGKNSVRDKHFR
jgi:hypothetical protein